MSAYARRRVDRHIANCRELASVEGLQNAQNVLASSFCLQFEMALGFYVAEIAQYSRKKNIQPWPMNAALLDSLVQQIDSPDLRELQTLAREPESWLWRMLYRLASLRQLDSPAAIKGEFFRSDLAEIREPVAAGSNQLIASSSSATAVTFEAASLMLDLDAFESLVHRQRLGHEEY